MPDRGPDSRRRAFLGRSDIDGEVREELEFHLAMVTDELVAGGWDAAAARAEAERRFGNLGTVHATCRTLSLEREHAMRRAQYLDALGQDVRYALRQLVRAPALTLVAVVTLGIGIGATTAIFSGVWSVVLRPFPWPEPDRVVMVAERSQGQDANVSVGNFVDWQVQSTAFAVMGAMRFSSFNLAAADAPERVIGGRVSDDFFAVFGIAPALGRVPTVDEQQPGGPLVVVLSDGLWRRLGADATLPGRDIRLNDRPYTVIGVMPSGFDPTLSGEELWVPIAFTPAQRAQHDEHYLFVAARLTPGVSVADANAEMNAIQRRLGEQFPLVNNSEARVVSLASILIGNTREQLFFVLGAVGLVLLIACGNVANLLLARGAARAHEIALRGALGAGRGRVIRQLLTESAVLGVMGAGLGVLLAGISVKVLVATAPTGIPRLGETRLDGVVLAFAVALALASSLLFGILPALRAARGDLQSTLRMGGRGSGSARDRVRSALVLGEVALAVTLLVGAGLLVRSALYLGKVRPGFDPEGVVTARVSLPAERYADPAQVRRTFTDLVRLVRESPGVGAASIVSQAPLGGGGGDNGLLAEGKAAVRENFVIARLRITAPGYFETVGIPVLRGRVFDERDRAGADRVMIVSQELANRMWPGEDPIGKRVSCCEGAPDDPRWKTVVGMAGDVRSRGPMVAVAPEFYLPVDQVPAEAWTWVQRTMTLVARGDGGGAAVSGALRAAVRAVDPAVPLFQVTDMRDALRASTAPARFNTVLLTALGLIGLVLAAVGIYGVVAYFVTTRTHEIGVRMALGAARQDVLRLMAWQGMRPVVAGTLLGVGAALALTRLLGGALYGVRPTDPLTFLVVVVLLLGVGLAAIVIPARRATRVDPMRALDAA